MVKPLKVALRADASNEIGTGHVMRCLTLAQALHGAGAECRFITRALPGHLADRIAAEGFEIELLPAPQGSTPEGPPAHAHWAGVDWERDAEETRATLGTDPPDWLVLDHYAFDARWQKAARPAGTKLMVIDDLADREHDCDLLLDQNLVADSEHRYDGKLPAHCGRMLGPDYALLQPQYADLHPRTPPREGPIRRVLVYFGGADTDNLTGRAITAFLSLQRDDVMLDVVINPTSPHADTIRQQLQGVQNAILHAGLPSLAPLMVKVDLAIGAGGATSWERCCLGLPTIVIALAENQKPIAAELDRQELIRWLGHKDQVTERSLSQALTVVLDDELAPDWSERCQRLVDGRGAERVRSLLLLNAETPLQARLARLDDEALILQWANDPLVRQNAFSTAKIDAISHRAWFRKRLRDLENCRIYVVETAEGLPVGQVRFERAGAAWEIDYALDARARGRGLGKPLIQSAILALRTHMEGALLIDRVKNTNRSSRRLVESLEFESEETAVRGLSIAVCSDAASWINDSIPELVLGWVAQGHRVVWAHDAGQLPGGALCFYLSYGRIVDAETRERYQHNLVVHESDLPKGRGWAPMSWQILEGAQRIPVTLLEAVDAVDAGPIYLQDWIELGGYELNKEWRALQAEATNRICRRFVERYPDVLREAREQIGAPTFYRKRGPKDSQLNPRESLVRQFNLLRVVDNVRYPAFFEMGGESFVVRIGRYQQEGGS